MIPSYRERLRTEGLAMAACGAAASAALVAFEPRSHRWPLNTAGQLAVTAALTARFGRRSARRAFEEAREVAPGDEGTGEATPLWMLPAIMGGLAAAFVALPATGLPGSGRAGWDAALRITGGCVVSGLFQAVVLERLVAEDERARGRRYVRAEGSTLLRGTKLAFTPA